MPIRYRLLLSQLAIYDLTWSAAKALTGVLSGPITSGSLSQLIHRSSESFGVILRNKNRLVWSRTGGPVVGAFIGIFIGTFIGVFIANPSSVCVARLRGLFCRDYCAVSRQTSVSGMASWRNLVAHHCRNDLALAFAP